MLYLYTGQQGNGKTISASFECKKFFENNYTIYSNIPFPFKYIKLTKKMIVDWEKDDFILPDKTVFFIDEIHNWFNSRNFSSGANKVISLFMSQLRHYTSDKQKGLTVIGTTQTFNQIDLNGRNLVDTVIECIKYDELKDEWIKVKRKYKKNINGKFRIIKKDKVKFDKEDFKIFDTQAKITTETEIKQPSKKDLKLVALYMKEQERLKNIKKDETFLECKSEDSHDNSQELKTIS